jgi:PadR family transcriptional regulator, regulatory protein PadR
MRMAQNQGLVKGTLDMMVLRILSRGEAHGWGITEKLAQLSSQKILLEEGTLYPALYRMEDKGWLKAEWKVTDKGQRAKYYTLTKVGRKQLEEEKESWARAVSLIAQVMES